MDEIVDLVVQKTGLPEEKARTAVETVIGYLKERLPDPLAAQVDNALSGKGVSPEDLGDLAKGLGGLLGKK
jgi:hypothetical protein